MFDDIWFHYHYRHLVVPTKRGVMGLHSYDSADEQDQVSVQNIQNRLKLVPRIWVRAI